MSSDDETSGRVAIGISFGNSCSSIACTISGEAKVIANEEGDRQIPSMLSYVDGEEFHGTQAKAQLVRNPRNTVAYFRDLIGKNFDAIDPSPCHNSAHPQAHEKSVAFSINDSASETPNLVTVSEVTTRHLKRLKNSASDYLGQQVNAAVITVPTEFSEAQKTALTDAANNAGIEVLQLIAEPVAALLANDGKNVERPADKVVIVADLGGTRSDVTVISIKGGMYSILATSHDYNLGGASLDSVLVDYFAKEFLKKHKATDPRTDERALAKLRLESEAAKKALSLGNSAGFNVESLVDGIDYSTTVNRTRYDLLAGKVFGSFGRLIEAAVAKAELDMLDIDDILLAGGTAHTPRIASNLRAQFPTSTTIISPSTSATAINPSELAARGAALQAYLVEGFEQEDIEQSTHPMVTVTPHLSRTIGFVLKSAKSGGEEFRPVIPAETPLPVRRTVALTSAGDDDGILLRLCEGIRDIKITKPDPKSKTNGVAGKDDEDEDDDFDEDEDEEDETREKAWRIGTTLGELALRGTKKGARVTVQISVTTDFEVSISAMEIGSGKPGVRGVLPGESTAMNGSAH